jgi:hypothetical protein
MSIDSADTVAHSLDKIAKAIEDTDLSPNLTRKQFVQNAMAQIISARLNGLTQDISSGLTDRLINEAFLLADGIYNKTRMLQVS